LKRRGNSDLVDGGPIRRELGATDSAVRQVPGDLEKLFIIQAAQGVTGK
jgi:hypothetical protein